MPAYAPTPRFADRRLHPKALLLIVGGHAVLLAAVMTVKMDLPARIFDPPIVIQPIPVPQDPPPAPQPQPRDEPAPSDSRIDRMPVIVPIPLPDPSRTDPAPFPIPLPDPGPAIGPGIEPAPQPQPLPAPDPVRVGPRLATPASQLRPPYPPSKLEREEEAALRLRLSIDARGRVVAVEPVGRTDRAFLEAARRHLIARWRYTPATQDGRPVASSTVITLRFELTD